MYIATTSTSNNEYIEIEPSKGEIEPQNSRTRDFTANNNAV